LETGRSIVFLYAVIIAFRWLLMGGSEMSGVAGRSGRKPKIQPAQRPADALEAAPCPDWLTGAGRELWQLLAPQLCAARILTGTDVQNLEAYCTAYGWFRQAEAEIEERGLLVPGANSSKVKNPACSVLNQAVGLLSTYGAMLGLDPAARRRLVGPDRAGGAGNPFAAILVRH
jgi:P27 family predicted phage terminase small subunit